MTTSINILVVTIVDFATVATTISHILLDPAVSAKTNHSFYFISRLFLALIFLLNVRYFI